MARSKSKSKSKSRSRSYSPRKSWSRSRSRSESRSWTPPASRKRRGYDDRRRVPTPPCSLLVRNISRSARPEDVRGPFEQFGHIKDVYLPKDFYTGEPRGFGFVQYMNPEDAARAKHHMDRQVLGGREITVVFAEENRKKPSEMRMKSRVRGGSGWGSRYGGGYYRHSPRRFRSRSRSYSPVRRYRSSRYDDRHGRSRYSSPSPARYRSPRHSPSESWSSPTRGRQADSRSPTPEKNCRKSVSPSPSREPRRASPKAET